MTRWMIGLAAVCAAMQGRAQDAFQPNAELGATRVPDDPAAWLLYTAEGRADLDDTGTDAPGHVRTHEVDISAALPVYSNDTAAVLLGAAWRWNRFDLGGGLDERYDLYMAALPVDLLLQPANRWLLWVNASPGVFTDFEHVTDDDARVTGHALVQYDWTPTLSLAAGAAYDREFGDDTLYPLGGAVWAPAPAWRVSLMFPTPQVCYAPHPRWLLFAEARPAGNLWNVHDEETGGPDYDFKLESWQIGAGAEFRLWNALWLHASAGADVERHYEIRRADRVELDSDTDDTWFLRAGVVAR